MMFREVDDFNSDEDSFEYSEEQDDLDWLDETNSDLTKRYNATRNAVHAGNAQSNVNSKMPGQYGEKSLSKFYNKINIEKYAGPTDLPQNAANKLIEHTRTTENNRIRIKDKHDRATVEQVLDPRTRMILFKLLSRNIVSDINGCISTGKEANVYHACSPFGDRAIKVYKTSILTFKDRDRYVTGEFRFRRGYCKGNPRKMVATWAEKEMRNLLRIRNASLPCPEPVILRGHVLVMEFLGSDGCYHEGQAYIIDVSQAVEHDHPHALEFLRKDCENIIEFFRRKGQTVLFVKELFGFITDAVLADDAAPDKLKALLEGAAQRENSSENVKYQEIEDEFFKKVFIPKRLEEVEKYEKDIESAVKCQNTEVFYPMVTGIGENLISVRPTQSGTGQKNPMCDQDSSSSESESCSTSMHEDSDSDASSSSKDSPPVDGEKLAESEKQPNLHNFRPRDESPNTKRQRKSAVKELKGERRKTKIPKNVKKRKEKLAKANSKRK